MDSTSISYSSPMLGAFAALTSSFTWALGITAYSKMAQRHSPFVINFTRACIGFPFFALAAVLFSNLGVGTRPVFDGFSASSVFWFFIAQIASYGLGDACFMWSALWMGVPGALAIGSVYPIWSALFGMVVHGDTLSILGTLGLALCVGGTVLVILSGSRRDGSSAGGEAPRPTAKGVLLALVASFFWSLNTIAISNTGPHLSSFSSNTLRMFISLILCAVFAKATSPRRSLFLGRDEYRRFGIVIILEVFVGSTVFLYGLSHAPLAVASALSALSPVIAAPIAWWKRTERFEPFKFLGIVSVVVGIVLLVGLGRTAA